MLCDQCGKNEAQVILDIINNNEKKSLHLCNDCFASQNKSNLTMDFMKPFQMISDFFDATSFISPLTDVAPGVLKCHTCGLTYNRFLENGRFGCADCYKEFREKLPQVFRKIHRSDRHTGKVPRGYVRAEVPSEGNNHKDQKPVGNHSGNREIETLEIKLKDAVRREDYETASELKQKINQLREGGTR